MATATSPDTSLEDLCINAVRVLSMDAVQKADSGHPGTPMALAPLGYLLYTKYLKHNPADPHWADRDRFVLSCGHASMFIYSLLYLTGYDVSLEDIKLFRQWESRTPGHPEYGYTPGVETTTGPLGQGVGNAVGMAVAEAQLAAAFNKDGEAPLVDHRTWFICSDGDLMEGISHEAASLAGHLKLGKLIGYYDDNHITIEGDTALTFTDDTRKRFEGYGWHVEWVGDINDLADLERATNAALAETSRPSLIICRTHIGFGSPNKHDSAKAHGEPLGEEEIKLTKQALGYPSLEPFWVSPDALAEWRKAKDRGAKAQQEWHARRDAYRTKYASDWGEFDRRMSGRLPAGWDADLPEFTADNGKVASRAASGVVLNAIAKKVPELVGGSADLAGSTNTLIKDAPSMGPDSLGGRNFHWGVREHGMGSVMNGMSLHGGLIPYGATFLVFSDYMRPAIRLAAIMKRHVVYVFTHDSIGLGEDGPTHQPIEHLTALRCIPELVTMRPADATETREAWRVAMQHDGPVALVLTRQKLGFIDRTKYGSAAGVARGAYVLKDSDGAPQVVLMSSGSEVALIMDAQSRLAERGVRARVVSMPSHELFGSQDAAYRESVLPRGVPRVAVEAAHPMSWQRWVGTEGRVLGIERFGASAPYQRIYEELGLTVEKVVEVAESLSR